MLTILHVSHLTSGQSIKKGRGLYKHEVLELTFQLYPPRGTGIIKENKSSWMNPVIDGEEANKLLGTLSFYISEMTLVFLTAHPGLGNVRMVFGLMSICLDTAFGWFFIYLLAYLVK